MGYECHLCHKVFYGGGLICPHCGALMPGATAKASESVRQFAAAMNCLGEIDPGLLSRTGRRRLNETLSNLRLVGGELVQTQEALLREEARAGAS